MPQRFVREQHDVQRQNSIGDHHHTEREAGGIGRYREHTTQVRGDDGDVEPADDDRRPIASLLALPDEIDGGRPGQPQSDQKDVKASKHGIAQVGEIAVLNRAAGHERGKTQQQCQETESDHFMTSH
ncbi:MAG: hypothetical protein SWK90_10675 [Chloroflexota bacterium]|nr:hypothetical protein [Chloroflexota bacterium]